MQYFSESVAGCCTTNNGVGHEALEHVRLSLTKYRLLPSYTKQKHALKEHSCALHTITCKHT